MKNKVLNFISSETVLCVCIIFGLASCFVIPPDENYWGYVDFRTLSILFCLMVVTAGFQRPGLFNFVAEKLLSRIHSVKALGLILVMLCFFFSMVITNDVALITFVPFTITLLNLLDENIKNKLLIFLTIMQTIAANLGSMLTPVGNPQNLYLHSVSGISAAKFIKLMLPFSVVSLLLLVFICIFKLKSLSLKINFDNFTRIGNKFSVVFYAFLFVLCLLTVARALDYRITLLITLAAVLIYEKDILLKVDYSLLLTFTALFVFIGNIGRIDALASFTKKIILGNECLMGVLLSQVISNVPAAILLCGFTDNYEALIVGTNLGGLGTLIASMASLISFKYILKENKGASKEYILKFTALNVVFLAILYALYIVLSR